MAYEPGTDYDAKAALRRKTFFDLLSVFLGHIRRDVSMSFSSSHSAALDLHN